MEQTMELLIGALLGLGLGLIILAFYRYHRNLQENLDHFDRNAADMVNDLRRDMADTTSSIDRRLDERADAILRDLEKHTHGA
jgi:hypothetical protein